MGIISSIYQRKNSFQQELKKEALAEAKWIASILGEKFGAEEVILYGSLRRRTYFDAVSDIDLAVKGLGDRYFKAYGYCLGLGSFGLDVRVYEDMPPGFKNRVDKEGRCLYAKGRQ